MSQLSVAVVIAVFFFFFVADKKHENKKDVVWLRTLQHRPDDIEGNQQWFIIPLQQ